MFFRLGEEQSAAVSESGKRPRRVKRLEAVLSIPPLPTEDLAEDRPPTPSSPAVREVVTCADLR